MIKMANTILSFFPLIIIMDSKYIIKGLMKHLKNWKQLDWHKKHKPIQISSLSPEKMLLKQIRYDKCLCTD